MMLNMKRFLTTVFLSGLSLMAQGPAAGNPTSTVLYRQYATAITNIIKSVEKMPEDKMSFKATPEVMSFMNFGAHVANANGFYCSAAAGGGAGLGYDATKTKTTKAGVLEALNEAKALCDKAWGAATDSELATKMVKMRNNEVPMLSVLTGNTAHTMEHYGNLVTYLRMNNIVPPSSEPKK
jgi:uncharacterized damage-inducible protein DinB